MKTITKLKLGGILLLLIAIIAAALWFRNVSKGNWIGLGTNQEIDITPTQIQSIKDIGEWEFLSVSAEELVDTIRKGIFTNDELVRIYYGTLRLGINMHEVEPGWIEARSDSVFLTLPPIGLLDKDFIDEARTKSFYQSGTWKPKDREAMYNRAYQRMLRHCLTPENLRAAETNADAQIRNMMRAMGYNKVMISYRSR
ncbi:MAG: DUF4230 domain-containing protein [Prevotella sp.]|nr:DUF4230 domain-containing protein [Prevotella sp.]